MGQFFTEFIMGLQNNTGANSSLSAYSSNALCNLIEFSEQRFLRDEFNSSSMGSLLPNVNSSASMFAAAAAAQQQQLNQHLNQQLIQHQQQLQQHHLQQFQQHFLQNISPTLSANLQQAQHLINNSNNTNGLQVNSSPGSNCSSPDAISQLSGTIKSEDHSNHSYVSEIRDNAIDKTRILSQFNPIELAFNASIQKQLSANANKTSLSKSELKFSVRSILSEENVQNSNLINSKNSTNSSIVNSLLSKQLNVSSENVDHMKSDKILGEMMKIAKKERIESPSKSAVSKAESFSSSSSASSSPSPENITAKQSNHELKANQQQSVKTIERRLSEKDNLLNLKIENQKKSNRKLVSSPEDNLKLNNKESEPIDYSATLAHYSSLLPNVELELLRNQNLAQLNNANAYPIKPSAHYAINFLRNSLANAFLPNAANFHHQTTDTFSLLNNAHQSINRSNSNPANDTPPVQSSKNQTLQNNNGKDIKQTSNYSSGHSISQQQQLISQQNHSPPQLNSSISYPNRLLHNPSQITPLGHTMGTLAWMSSARGKPRRGMMRRAVFSDAQRQGLEKRFQLQKYISKPDRKKLADDLGLKDSQVKIWYQNRRMKWRNSKERELLSHGGSREQTLPTKNNPNPDLTDVGTLLTAEKLRNSNLTVHQLKQLKMQNAALMNDPNCEMETDADEIDIEGYSDTESQASNYDKMQVVDSLMNDEMPINEDAEGENRETISNKVNSSTYKQETVNSKIENS